MVRVLHLHPAQCDLQTRRCVEQLVHDLGDGYVVAAQSIGIGGDLHHLPGAVAALRSTRRAETDLVHAWGPVELAVAALSGFSRIVFTPPASVSKRWFRWISLILHRRRVEIVCPTATLRRVFVEQGAPSERCHVVAPGFDPSRLRSSRNQQLRAELGFGDSDFVLLAPGESDYAADHRQSVWCAAILNVLDPRYRLLTWGCGPLVESLNRFSKRVRQESLLVQASHDLHRDVDFEELIAVADAGLILSPGIVPTLPIGLCMAGGLPIISNVTSTLVEVLEDNRTALMVPRATPKTMAQRVLDLCNNPSLRSQIIEGARADALGYFSKPNFLARYKHIYERVAADGAIELSSPAALMSV